ncbi:hypothetical protein MRX96_009864 [Rhipicephalus microplus]
MPRDAGRPVQCVPPGAAHSGAGKKEERRAYVRRRRSRRSRDPEESVTTRSSLPMAAAPLRALGVRAARGGAPAASRTPSAVWLGPAEAARRHCHRRRIAAHNQPSSSRAVGGAGQLSEGSAVRVSSRKPVSCTRRYLCKSHVSYHSNDRWAHSTQR